MSEAMISVENVTKTFGHVTALENMSLDVQPGETFALLGPNGAGKTTLIRIILDMIRPDSGTVRVGGKPFADEDRVRVAYLPEERGLYARRKVLTVLEYFGALKLLSPRQARRSAAEWLARLDITEHRDKRISELSKGNQQKVQLAATLIADPDIAILDEPMSGLDPVSARLVTSVIRELHDRGKTIILSSHQMSLVESVCDRVLMVSRGRRVLYGPLASVRREHSDNAVLVRSNADYARMATVERVVETDGTTKVFLKAGVRPADFLALLVNGGAAVEFFEPAVTHLEDIFVKLAGGAN